MVWRRSNCRGVVGVLSSVDVSIAGFCAEVPVMVVCVREGLVSQDWSWSVIITKRYTVEVRSWASFEGVLLWARVYCRRVPERDRVCGEASRRAVDVSCGDHCLVWAVV